MNRHIIASIVFMTIIILTIFANAESNTTSIIYRSNVDQDYGFYRVINIVTHQPAPYMNNTLTINTGDTVEWINDATPDEPLTIISKDGLWGNRSAYLRWNFQRFNYTFNEAGTYDVYIREYPREQHQIIIVNPVNVTKVIESTLVMTPMNIMDTIENTSVPIVTNTISPKNVNDEPNIWILIILLIMMLLVLFIMYMRRKK